MSHEQTGQDLKDITQRFMEQMAAAYLAIKQGHITDFTMEANLGNDRVVIQTYIMRKGERNASGKD